MRPIGLLLIYFAVVFPGGALLAPWLYKLAHWAGDHWSVLAGLAGIPFHRVLDRALLGLALAGLWPLLRGAGVRSWPELGLPRRTGSARQVLGGFLLGWASLAAAACLALVCGASSWNSTRSGTEVFRSVLNATWSCVVVAVLEEILFRGSLFGILRRAVAWPAALVVSSAVYAAVHFIQKAETALPVQWDSGLSLLWAMFSHPPALIPAFLTLFVAGAILALCYQGSGALYFPIGLHAGWIFWLKSYRFLFHPTGLHTAFWGTDALIDGWLSFIILTALLGLVVWNQRSKVVNSARPSS